MISVKKIFSDLYYSVTIHNFRLLSLNIIIACSQILQMDGILTPTNQAIMKTIWVVNSRAYTVYLLVYKNNEIY